MHPRMSLDVPASLPTPTKQSRIHVLFLGAACKTVVVFALFLLFLYISSLYSRVNILDSFSVHFLPSENTVVVTPTNLSHVVFGVIGSSRYWNARRPYVESWWRPNATRGYLFVDRYPKKESLCPSTCPPIRINEDIRNWEVYPQIRDAVQMRMFRTILEVFRQGDRDVRWFVMADDDTVLFVDNIVDILSKYDHTKYFYIGASSESIHPNAYYSFQMGFGGAGYALSYPLVKTMSKSWDRCLKRYPYMSPSDYLISACLANLGVALSSEKGFHQIDLRHSIKGLLSSHPQTPFLSLHHIDAVDPIFPSRNRFESINHLMKPAGVDQSRLLQQTICYQREKKWSISVSWGYSAHIYENILPRFVLRRPLETFKPWNKNAMWPQFMFNTRLVKDDPCEAPHWFFLESIEPRNEDEILTTYSRAAKRGLGTCSLGGNHSAEYIDRIQVFSPAKTRLEVGTAECCDILPFSYNSTITVRIRPCMEAEEIA